MIARFDDPEFAAAYRDGKRGAMDAVFREHARPLECYLRRSFLFQKWELSDAIQETFLRAFAPEARRAYDCTRPYRNYLFTIAKNIIINEMKRPFRFREVSVEELDCPDFRDSSPDLTKLPGDRAAEINEMAFHFEGFKATLSEQERTVLEVRFLGQESTLMTAAKLNLSRQNVRTIEKSIRKKAYKYFRAAGFNVPAVVVKVALLFVLCIGWGAIDSVRDMTPLPDIGGHYES